MPALHQDVRPTPHLPSSDQQSENTDEQLSALLDPQKKGCEGPILESSGSPLHTPGLEAAGKVGPWFGCCPTAAPQQVLGRVCGSRFGP